MAYGAIDKTHYCERSGLALTQQVARGAGLSRESLYKALGESGNPSFATILKVAHALGLRLHAQAS